ncbi:MAG: hypothetical protein HGA60_09110 [Chlorobiaceae bacterium]|nr:hypothetical protein [Chlorobiaceae bacterium]
MKRFPGLKTLAILCISLFTTACAVDRPPTGGPPDKEPLTVTASSPEPGSVNVTTRTIRIEFNRYVTSPAVRKALIFSPVVRNYEITMHGRVAEIRFLSPLDPAKTYTITLKRSLKGFFGNELASSWSLPFSTGPVIDRGTLDGRVWNRKLAPAPNITVMAYATGQMQASAADSLNAAPDYATQTDANGNFSFESLAPGDYRLVAVDDRNSNLRFDRLKEEFGVSAVSSVHTGEHGLTFRLASGDTTPVSIRSAKPVSTSEIEIQFSRPVPTRTLNLSAISIRDLSTGSSLPVPGYYSVTRAEEEQTFRLQTGVMNPKSQYTIAFQTEGAKTTPEELTFLGGLRPANWPPLTISIFPPDKAINALLDMVRPDAGPCIELQCNLPVEEASIRRAVNLEAIRNGGEQTVPATVSRYDSRTWTVRPVSGFESGTDYKVSVHPSLVTTLLGSKGKDTLVVSRFSAASSAQYGEITGTGISSGAVTVIEARRSGTNMFFRRIVRPSAGGAFSYSFTGLPPGNYTIFAFAPAPGPASLQTPEWNAGSIDPFRPADPFIAVEANVRQGWTTQVPSFRLPVAGKQPAPVKPMPPAKKKPRKR